MRVVTNDKHIAEQIKSDSTFTARECPLNNRKVKSTVMDGVKSKRRGLVKNIVMDGPKVGNFGKVVKEQHLKSVVTGGVISGKFEKMENYENGDETISQSEERLCKSIRSHETQS